MAGHNELCKTLLINHQVLTLGITHDGLFKGDMATSTSENHQLFSPTEMMAEAEKFALSKANKTSSMTLSLAIMAGAFIGLAFYSTSR